MKIQISSISITFQKYKILQNLYIVHGRHPVVFRLKEDEGSAGVFQKIQNS
jgi:hypothetical protein